MASGKEEMTARSIVDKKIKVFYDSISYSLLCMTESDRSESYIPLILASHDSRLVPQSTMSKDSKVLNADVNGAIERACDPTTPKRQ